MGARSEIIGYGKFSPDLLEDLGFTEDCYEHCTEETTITEKVVFCVTSSMSRDLAHALSFGLSDMHKHVMDAKHIADHTTSLLSFAEQYPQMEDEIKWLMVLASKGWTFLFQPEY